MQKYTRNPRTGLPDLTGDTTGWLGGLTANGEISAYPSGENVTTAQEFIDAFFDSQNPSVSLSTTPSANLREFGNDVVNPDLLATPQLGQNPPGTLTLLEWFRGGTGGTLINTESNPAPGTSTNFQDTFTVSSNQQYTVRITDSESRTGTASKLFDFTYPMRAGVINTGDIVDATTYTRTYINGLSGLSLRVVNKSDQSVTTSPSTEKYVFVYPASYGSLTSVIDDNGFETISDYDIFNITIDPMLDGTSQAYTAYVLKNNTTQTGFTNTYKF